MVNFLKCQHCKALFDTNFRDQQEGNRLPISCSACPYTVCGVCFTIWLAKDQSGLIECPDCETIDGFNASQPNINYFACQAVASVAGTSSPAPTSPSRRPTVMPPATTAVTPPPPPPPFAKKRPHQEEIEDDESSQKKKAKKQEQTREDSHENVSSGIEVYLETVEKNSKGKALSDANVKSSYKNDTSKFAPLECNGTVLVAMIDECAVVINKLNPFVKA